jgi:hypothetical protein
LLLLACALYLPAGLVVGGGLATGQAEQLRWGAASLYFAAFLAFLFRREAGRQRWRGYGAAVLLSTAMVIVFCGVAGQFWAWERGLLLGAINLLLIALMDGLFRFRRAAGFVLAAALLAGLLLPARLWLWPLDEPGATESRRRLAVMTSLPLGPVRGRAISEVLSGREGLDPVTAALSRHFRLEFVDFLSAPSLAAGEERLLLAHPRALQPAELVALDHWVREGGKALILADPALVWPSDLPLGDQRRPPVTSLLDPLLTHWGVTLEPAGDARTIIRRRMDDGRLLATVGESRFGLSTSDCVPEAEALLARCRIGEGEALLVADADLLNPALWMGEYGTGGGRDRISDNMQLAARWLGVRDEELAPRTGWILKSAGIGYGFAAASLPVLFLLALLLGGRRKRHGK